MTHLVRNQHGMNIVGQGGKILLFTLPALIAAVLLHAYRPDLAALPDGLAVLRPLGYGLLAPGLLLWASAVVQLLRDFPRGSLVTSRAYSVVRNPIYSSVAFFVLPGVTLLTTTWVYLAVAAFLCLGVMRFIGAEERQLRATFGAAYEEYLLRVDRLIPFKKP